MVPSQYYKSPSSHQKEANKKICSDPNDFEKRKCDIEQRFGQRGYYRRDIRYQLQETDKKTRQDKNCYSGADKWPITECSVQIFNKDFFGPIFFALCPQ